MKGYQRLIDMVIVYLCSFEYTSTKHCVILKMPDVCKIGIFQVKSHTRCTIPLFLEASFFFCHNEVK